MPSQLLFLPGASGNTQFWRPVAGLLQHPAEHRHLGWPGFGPTPPDPLVDGIDGLVAQVVAQIDRPTALVAQSMGGVVAIRAALERPGLVTHLVLTATSGGLSMADLGAHEWQRAFIAANPALPRWFTAFNDDLSARIGSIAAPALLLWGDADPISPVAVGRRLASLLPRAELHVLAGGTHELGQTFASSIAPLIDAHLASSVVGGPGVCSPRR